MQYHNNEQDYSAQVLAFLLVLLLWLELVLLAVFYLSTWMTRYLFQLLLIPLWPRLEQEDGMVILLSGGVWSAVTSLGLFPFTVQWGILETLPYDLLHAWIGSAVVGGIWGALVSVYVLTVWWDEVVSRQAQPAFTTVLGLDGGFYESDETADPTSPMTLEELEKQFQTMGYEAHEGA